MNQPAHSVDIRIKRFMKQKMSEFPEIEEVNDLQVADIQRGYLWDDMMNLFRKRGLN